MTQRKLVAAIAAMVGLAFAGSAAWAQQTTGDADAATRSAGQRSEARATPGASENDQHVANWLGCLAAINLDLLRTAAGRADVADVNRFVQKEIDHQQALLAELRKYSSEAGAGIGEAKARSAQEEQAADANQFSWKKVSREVANADLGAAKRELNNRGGLDFDWAVVGQQQMLCDKMCADMKVLRRYASPALGAMLDDQLAEAQKSKRGIEQLMDRLKTAEYREHQGDSRGDQQASDDARSRNQTSRDDDRGRASASSQRAQYIEEYTYAETAFTTGVRLRQGPEGRATLGVRLEQNADREVVISKVVDDGPAAKAGLQPGDVLLAVNGQEIHSPAELRRQLSRSSQGDQVQLLVDRTRFTRERIPFDDAGRDSRSRSDEDSSADRGASNSRGDSETP